MEDAAAGEGERREEKGPGQGGSTGVVRVSLCMLLVQVFQTGMAVLSKLALNQGMVVFPFLVYRNAIGAICVSCFALILESLTMAMSFFYYGLRDTSAAYSSIFINLIPVATFIFSVALRVESLGLRKGNISGIIKVLGTVVCVGGAMVISRYKGKVLHIWPFHINITHAVSGTAVISQNLPRGTSFLIGSCVSYALWFILQVKMFKAFPSIYWSTALTCLVGCLQSGFLGLLFNRETTAWLVRTKLQLVTIVYSSVLNTAVTSVIVTWAVSKRGPIFPSIFAPLSLIFITIVESLLMGLEITIGSLLGMFLIIVGIYAFLWAKTRELTERQRSAAPLSVGAGDIGMVSTLPRTRSTVMPDPVQDSAQQKVEKLPV
ncbi:hypothetical protein Taro_018167 [Colocasia esculenta]|uniref:WAT1-related protein n=1 Tax=Colocasia esculenta TaxID=4460 RepID=A0A843UVI3_COLES|nr:hypothetical protein [Colocasia esculenta]